MKIPYDLSNQRFNKLIALDYIYKNKRVYWRCLCDCNKEKYVLASHLKSGKIKSCGCYSAKRKSEIRKIEHKFVDDVECKYCGLCKEYNPLDNFGDDKDKWDNKRSICKKCTNKINKKYKIKNKGKVLERSKVYHNLNKNKEKQYRLDNKERFRESRNQYLRKRNKRLNVRLANSIRARIRLALFGKTKSQNTFNLLGCTVDELKRYLESQFTEKMTWENYGSFWNMDHIKPCAMYDLSNSEQQKECFYYTNLQPLKVMDNATKNSFYNGIKHYYKNE